MSDRTIEVRVPCLYQRVWDDGFGARGWKLSCAAADPEVIASTPVTGDRIPTSVFVHDILDHRLCGLGPSGHRNEAVALLQLAARTGSDPHPDFAQMVDEDLLRGQAVGEAIEEFLPQDMKTGCGTQAGSGKTIIPRLRARLGHAVLRDRLIARFYELGAAGVSAARARYEEHGLDDRRRGPLGLAIQRLLEQADAWVLRRALDSAAAEVWITPRQCGFQIQEPGNRSWKGAY